jgi:hypothetical protein
LLSLILIKNYINKIIECSNAGVCIVNSPGNFSCKCDQYYKGNNCEIDQRKCSKKICINNGECKDLIINDTNYYDYECNCKPLYYGKNCELKQKLCKNRTCSNYGRCIENITDTYCSCSKGFSGLNCEIASRYVTVTKAVIINFLFLDNILRTK